MGMGFASLGSDPGGSIRIPAALCGVTGLKPTYGRVSRHGLVPLAWSLDHAGPIARTAHDCAIVLGVIAGNDPKDPTSSVRPVPDYLAHIEDPIDNLTIGVPAAPFWDPIEPEVADAVGAAIQTLTDLGVRVREVQFPLADEVHAIQSTIIFSEAAAYHAKWLRERPQDYASSVLNGLRQGALIPAADYINAQRARAILRKRMDALLRQVDVLVLPTVPIVAPKIGQAQGTMLISQTEVPTTRALTRNVSPFNLLGLPALTAPCGFDSQELPIGLQIVGRPFDEETVLRTGHAYQKATDWHLWRPPMDTTP
jgi:aspartyl-tRNA(Asn)/glutamyl-tRNA(Gln) amidotransferase subunit A